MRKITLTGKGDCLVARISTADLGFTPTRIWSSSPGMYHRTTPYRLPRRIRIGVRESMEAGAKFSPAPFAVVVQGGREKCLVAVGARAGWHRFGAVDFVGRKRSVEVRVDLEGHTAWTQAVRHIGVYLLRAKPGENSMALVRRGMEDLYPAAYGRARDTRPDWWHRPIYCGWGDQVGASVAMEGPGPEPRALVYCTQGLYERWLKRLEEADVPIGTVCIDAGWSLGGVWQPLRSQWPDLRAFIDGQHKKGRKVLLWLATWYTEGLPDKWCVHVGERKLVADPTNAAYRRFLRESTARLVSRKRGCFNADGFKIDQLRYVPSEREPWGGEHFGRNVFVRGRHPGIKLARGDTWGLELLYQLQKDVYQAAKNAKRDCLVSSSTVHPYFHDTLDMVRLHDTGSVDCDVVAAMTARADLARAALPDCVIDADDWVHSDYRKWMDYTLNSYRIGVPCIFYAERFVYLGQEASGWRPIALKDLKRIGRRWRQVCRAPQD
jgi:hypothetical protein